MFKLVHFKTPMQDPKHPPPDISADIWWLATKSHMVGERVVRIIQERFLVNINRTGTETLYLSEKRTSLTGTKSIYTRFS